MKRKTTFTSRLPRAVMVCLTPLLVSSAAFAGPIAFYESNDTNSWTLPAGPNLLTGAAISGTLTVQLGASTTWTTLTDGSVGPAPNATTPNPSALNTVVAPANDNAVTYALDLTGNPNGYTITALDSYGLWNDPGRDDQNYTFSYSTDGVNFIPLISVNNHTPNPGTSKATHTRITDESGILATNVKAVRIKFDNPQENNAAGYTEFILTNAPVDPLPITSLNESNSTNVWVLPAGTNLLDAAMTPSPPPPSTSPSGGSQVADSWAALTDGILGDPGNTLTAVTVTNGTEVIFPMKNLATNTKGYDLTSLDFYSAWADGGRDDLNFEIEYSTWDDPETFLPLTVVANHTPNPNPRPADGKRATHTRLTAASGFLATNVAAVKFIFEGQENGWAGHREFIALGQASPLSDALTWTGANGSGGNANWTNSAQNWNAPYSSLSPLIFPQSGANRNINVSSALTASSMTFSHDNTPAYVFGGQKITVTNGITSSGAGATTFSTAIAAGTGAALTGAGSLTFNGDLESTDLSVSGTGSITLAADNQASGTPTFAGTAAVSNGSLNVTHNSALKGATLSMTGGTANFTTATPEIAALTGSGGTINLGNTTLTVGTDSPALQNLAFAGNIAQVSGTGAFTKAGESILNLSGANSYTGPTRVTGGVLQIAKRQSLYNGNTAAWTGTNVVVSPLAALTLSTGSAGEFTDSDLTALSLTGFGANSTLAINATGASSAVAPVSRNITGPINFNKQGSAVLRLTGSNSFTGTTRVRSGTLVAAGEGKVTLPGDVFLGDGANQDVFLSMGADNQFGPNSVLHLDNVVFNGSVAKVQLRGTNQTIAGLVSPPSGFRSIIQNDETVVPDFVENPDRPEASLTINTADGTFYSFRGIIRDQSGPPVSLIKNGPGTQELINLPGVQPYNYTGPTIVNEGTFTLNFDGASSGFGSDITLNNLGGGPATLNFKAPNGVVTFNRLISGEGKVLVDGFDPIVLTNGGNSWSGGTTVFDCVLALNGINTTGEGTAEGDTCVAGAMTPTNVIRLVSSEFGGATLQLDNTAALGNSFMLPEFAPSIFVGERSRIFGGTNTVAFVPNITLDGGRIEISSGANAGGFGTNLALVGTVVVGGTSTNPAEILTVGEGANANASLGSIGLPGTVFNVADVTNNATADLTVSSILRDVSTVASPLTKTGPGTMVLTGANTYTGVTTVTGGELSVNGTSIGDTNALVLNGGKLHLAANETVGTLSYAGVLQAAGTYGSTASTATNKDDTRFSGAGVLTVGQTTTPGTTYETWAEAIPNANDRDRADDPDGDGFLNIDEFLFGTLPTAANGSLSSVEKSGTNLIVRWIERVSGSSVYLLQESTTLENPWLTSAIMPATATDQSGLDPEQYLRKQATIPITGSRKFVRIHATE